ncbi:MAG: hypothetical protein JSV37_14850 [Anaerolineaceae bacterium]|nr:MAG: hypothetical protein JSV37_14850 [Anaerolineaceae bacterium]
MKAKNRLGILLTLIGAVLGIVGTYLIFLNWYSPALTAEAAEPGCEILLKYLMPALSDFGILAGVLYAVSAYGFFTAAGWAFPVAALANVLALQGSWFINVPFMAAGMPPVYFIIFWPNLILYFLLMKVVGGLSWNRTLLGLVTGMAFIFCFMNGVASWSRIITIGSHIFVAVQRLNWVAFIGWGVVAVGILLRPKEWMRVLGLTAGVLELVVGIPLGVITTINLGRFSMFSLGPIFSLVLVVLFLWPNMWQRLTQSPDEGRLITQAA